MNEIIELFQKLSPEGKTKALQYLASLVAQQKSSDNKPTQEEHAEHK